MSDERRLHRAQHTIVGPTIARRQCPRSAILRITCTSSVCVLWLAACGGAHSPSAAIAAELVPPVAASNEQAGSTNAPKDGVEAPVAWEQSEPDARARAKREQRPLLVYLRADWSAASLELERGVWSDPAVRRELRRFVTVKIDVTHAEADAEFWAQRYGARGIPTTVLVDGEGRTASVLHGAFAVEELMRALQQAD